MKTEANSFVLYFAVIIFAIIVTIFNFGKLKNDDQLSFIFGQSNTL